MSKADGSVIINTELDTSDVKKGAGEIKEELQGVGENAEKANGSVGGDLAKGFKKLGKAIAAAGVIDMLVDFGKEAIALGSDLEEVQNVVDVTFTTMSKQVNKFAKNAQKTAGLSEKMAKQYVGTFGAMADSFGFTELEAYEMSTALTQLTGDVASFYNLSQDEAMNKLKGVFTGETEALKELGVVMTQAALDNYALANGFSKTTSEMTEQEKVALRYQFVMDQLSAASGDFARTQDSWANQSRILALQWESFMATLGTGLIGVLSPFVSFLNDKMLPALQDVADYLVEVWDPSPSEALADSIKNTSKTVKKAKEQFAESAEAVERNAIMAEYYRDRLYELESAGLDTAEAQDAYAGVVANLNELYPELNLQINEQTGLLDENSRAQLANIAAMKEKYLMLAVEEEATALYQAQADAQKSLAVARRDLETVNGSLETAEIQLAATTSLSVDEMISLYNATEMSAGVVQNMDGSVIALSGDQMDLVSQIISWRQEQENLDEKISEGQAVVDSFDAEIYSLYETYGITADAASNLADGQNQVSSTADAATQKVEELQKSYLEAKQAARDSIDSQIGLFDELKAESELTTEDIVENWKSQQAGFDQYKQDLQKAVELGLDETLVKQLSDGSTESMAILNNLVSDTDLNVQEFNEHFRATEEARETVSEMMAGIQTDLAGRFADMYSSVSGAWGDMDNATKTAITNMQKSINSLYGKTIYITTKYQTSGSPSGSSSSGYSSRIAQPSTYTADIPYLAKGTVIPPNAPFMAVLGDQKHGTNIEAPLSTIQEAVSNVLQDSLSSGFAAMIREQKATQEILKNIEIGDTVIGEAVDRYNWNNNIIRGGAV